MKQTRRKKIKPVYKNITFDSKDEIDFYILCEDFKRQGLILYFEYQPEPFILLEKQQITCLEKLKTMNKPIKKTLLQPASYTPDFWVLWDADKASHLLHVLDYIENHRKPLIAHMGDTMDVLRKINEKDYEKSIAQTYIDIKFDISDVRNGNDFHNQRRIFSLTRKWVWSDYDVYINELSVKGFLEFLNPASAKFN